MAYANYRETIANAMADGILISFEFSKWLANPIGFVASLNVNRRHLSESQRAMAAANLANMAAHRPSDKSANLPTSAVTQPQAAEMLQVSERSVRTAAKVKRTAPAEVVEAMNDDRL